MTPNQAQVWSRYHKATDALADATDALLQAHAARRAGMLGNAARYEEIAVGALAEYRAARAAVESL